MGATPRRLSDAIPVNSTRQTHSGAGHKSYGTKVEWVLCRFLFWCIQRMVVFILGTSVIWNEIQLAIKADGACNFIYMSYNIGFYLLMGHLSLGQLSNGIYVS